MLDQDVYQEQEHNRTSLKVLWIYHLALSLGVPIVMFLLMPKNETAGMGWLAILNYVAVIGVAIAPISIGIYLEKKIAVLLALLVYSAFVILAFYFALPWTWIASIVTFLLPGFYFSYAALRQLD